MNMYRNEFKSIKLEDKVEVGYNFLYADSLPYLGILCTIFGS